MIRTPKLKQSWLDKLSVTAGPATNARNSTPKVGPLSIADAIQDCTKLFCSIIALQPKESGLPKPPPRLSKKEIDTTPLRVSELFDRYKIWYTNMGTYENRLSSLDYHLRDASNVSVQVISLLSELNGSLRDGKKRFLQFFKKQELIKSYYDTDKVLKVFEIASYEEGQHQAFDPYEQTLDSSAQTKPILADINHIVHCLYRLSGVIEDPAPHNQIIYNATADMTKNVSQDLHFMKAKHANISEDLAERLTNAISVRRAYLSYRKEEYDNIQTNPVSGKSQPHIRTEAPSAMTYTPSLASNTLESNDSPSSISRGMEEAIYMDLPQKQQSHESLASPSDMINQTPVSENLSSSTQTSNGPSRVALLVAGRMKEEGEHEYGLPRIPTGPASDSNDSGPLTESGNLLDPDSGHSFPSRCPLCWTNVYINVADWKKHFFSDLRPYMCVETDCPDPERLYKSDQEWIWHVRHNHWTGWVCTAGCKTSFTQAADLEQHLRVEHAKLADKHLNTLVELGERPGAGFHGIECPLCPEKLTTEVQYQQHIGQHQERLASLALHSEESHDRATASIEIDIT